MLINSDITVFNFYKEKWIPCIIRGVWFFMNDAIKFGIGIGIGPSENCRASIRIPITAAFDKEFVSPFEFDNSDKEKFFTLRPGDLIIKGIYDSSLVPEPQKDSLMKKYLTCEIISVTDNRFGSINSSHWHILGN